MIRHWFAALALMITLLAGSAIGSKAQADGISEKLSSQFDLMVNYTKPSSYMGARRGVISGGSLSIRTPSVNIKPFSLRGPSVSIGCGGIDAYFGGFSFITKEQLVQAMRAIVTAAITYAFQLALEAMCPTCADVMKDLQNKLNMVNEALTNSCEATRNFMDTSPIRGTIEKTASNWGVAMGLKDDHKHAKNQGSTQAIEGEARTASAGKVFEELPTEGNHVWQILKKSANSSFGFSDDGFLEEIMSMTGTVIACSPDEASPQSCAQPGKVDGETVAQKGEISIFRKPPIMTLSTLVEGGTADAKTYQCDTVSKCSGVTIRTNPVEGMAKQIRQAYLGADDGSAVGIIDKLRMYGQIKNGPTPDEEKWMKIGGAFTAMLMRLAVTDPDKARGFVRDNAEAIAAEIVVGYLDRWLLSAKVAAGRTELSGLKEAIDMIEAANATAREDAKKYYEMSSHRSQIYRTYNVMNDPRSTN